jgi:hypothetical protein
MKYQDCSTIIIIPTKGRLVDINKLGYKIACDTRIKVGHIDEKGKVW